MRKIFLLAMTLFLAACGGAPGLDEASDDVGVAYSLFSVQRDERKCAAPMCGGWWATATQQSPVYVSDLDLARAQLDARTEQAVRGAPAEELLLKARISGRTLIVKTVWRGMPGIVPAATDAVWSMAKTTATDAVSNRTASVASVDVSGAAKAFVDRAWLADRVAAHGALAAAHVSSKVMSASQVWLRLPESAGPCPKPAEPACGGSQVNAYSRTADRCLQPLGCVDRGICPMMAPSCPEGYVAVTWTAADGCAATACDPAWSL